MFDRIYQNHRVLGSSLSLFAGDVIPYVEDSEDSTKKPLITSKQIQ